MRARALLFAVIMTCAFLRAGPSDGLELQDLYFFDANDQIYKLDLYPKVFVRFKSAQALAEADKVFAKFPTVKSKESAKGFETAFAVSFVENPNKEDLLKIINDVNASGLAEARPVFLVENIEAVVDGFFVQPRAFVTIESLKKRMRIYGEFEADVEQISSVFEGGLFKFGVSKTEEPLNLFRLMNFAHKDPWIRRAYPNFVFLHDPITASLSVEPSSGTIGEERKLILEVRIFGPKMKFRDDLLPAFGEGKFAPTVNYKLPQSYLFEVVGEKTKEETETERGRVIRTTWRFKQFSVGTANISAVPVSYERNGAPGKIDTPSVSLVSVSLIKDLDIKEMPSAKVLTSLKSKLEPFPVRKSPSPVYWFDILPVESEVLAYAGAATAVFSGLAALFVPAAFLFAGISKARARRKKENDFCREVEYVCEAAPLNPEPKSAKRLENTFYAVLSATHPELSKHPTIRELKDAGLWQKFASGFREDLTLAFGFVEKMYAPNFESEQKDLADFAKVVLQILNRSKIDIKMATKRSPK